MKNPMTEIDIEKIVLNCGGVEDKLERSAKLLHFLTGKKVKIVESKKRIPAFEVRPGLKVGCTVTIRKQEKYDLLKRLLEAIDKRIKKKQIKENGFGFGIKEYLEIPGIEYQREIGILGLEVAVVFARKGKRVALKKAKSGKIPSKQNVTPEEIEEYIKNKFKVELI